MWSLEPPEEVRPRRLETISGKMAIKRITVRAASGKDTRGGEGRRPVFTDRRETLRAERERDGGAGEGESGGPGWVAGLPLPATHTAPAAFRGRGGGGGVGLSQGRGTRASGEAFVPKEAARPAAPRLPVQLLTWAHS